MLGYVKNKQNYYVSSFKEYKLKEAIAFSGGTQRHYTIFNNLLNYSIFNNTLNAPIHDTRAAQACLFLYPIPVRIFLSLVLYREELNLIEEYDSYELVTDLITPNNQLLFSNLITRSYISKRLFRLLEEIPREFTLTDDFFRDLKVYFNLKDTINLDSKDLKKNIVSVLNIFNESRDFNSKFIEVAYNNNRMDAIVAVSNALNYKAKSTNMILQTTERWLLETSNT